MARANAVKSAAKENRLSSEIYDQIEHKQFDKTVTDK